MLTHQNILVNLEQSFSWLLIPQQESFTPPWNDLLILPLYHISGLTAFLSSFLFERSLIIISKPKDINALVALLAEKRPNSFVAVNTTFNALLQHPDIGKVDFSQLRYAVATGAPLQIGIADKWKKLTGIKILSYYGLTENPGVAISSLQDDNYRGEAGIPTPSTEISIRDDQDNEVSLGQSGEIWVRSPTTMLGYWRQTEETKKILTSDGW